MEANKKDCLLRILTGGLVGTLLLLPFGAVLNGWSAVGPPLINSAPPQLISAVLAQRLGSEPGALLLQVLLYFALGAAVGLATRPFAGEGRTLVVASLAHFAATGVLTAVLVLLCGWHMGRWDTLAFYMGALVVIYLLIWLGRWVGWCAELAAIRKRLGLEAGPSPLKWRETLPYLGFAFFLCLLLPTGLGLLDGPVPVLTGLFYPWLLLPVGGFFSGLALGRRQGVCPLYPVSCAVFCLIFIPLSRLWCNMAFESLLPIAVLFPLLGDLIGAAWRKVRGEKEDARGV